MPGRLDGKEILVVDDDKEIAASIEMALKEEGASVHTALDGIAAVKMAEQIKPDLVVLDQMLPGRSGFLVMEKLMGKTPDERPRVIMITANEGKRHRAYAEGLGVDDYMNKPFRMERLVQSAEKLLS